MKLTCNQSDLIQHLTIAGRAVSSRPSHPVLANILLEALENRVSVTGFDLSLGIKTSFHCPVEQPGAVTIPAKLLTDIVAKITEDEITIAVEDTGMVHLETCTGKYSVMGMAPTEFPALPTLGKNEPVALPLESLSEGLRRTVFASSTDETKAVLTGVHLRSTAESLEFAATDGHRLAVVSIENTAECQEFELTLPSRAIKELERMASGKGEDILLFFEDGQAIVQRGEQCLTSRTLDGQYPQYNQLIPKQFELNFTVDRKLFVSALERIAVLADQKNNLVRLGIRDDQSVVLSVQTQDLGSGKESLPAQVSGGEIDIAFNVKYLMEGLKALPSNEIQVSINTPTSPVISSPLNGLKMTYLVMPVQIRD